jgi:hypothetical protein
MYRIDVKDLLRAKVGPDPLETIDCPAPLVSFSCQYAGGNRTRGRPNNHLEWIAGARQ